jgi:hypothetical protein
VKGDETDQRAIHAAVTRGIAKKHPLKIVFGPWRSKKLSATAAYER